MKSVEVAALFVDTASVAVTAAIVVAFAAEALFPTGIFPSFAGNLAFVVRFAGTIEAAFVAAEYTFVTAIVIVETFDTAASVAVALFVGTLTAALEFVEFDTAATIAVFVEVETGINSAIEFAAVGGFGTYSVIAMMFFHVVGTCSVMTIFDTSFVLARTCFVIAVESSRFAIAAGQENVAGKCLVVCFAGIEMVVADIAAFVVMETLVFVAVAAAFVVDASLVG